MGVISDSNSEFASLTTSLDLIYALLGAPTQCEGIQVLPEEVKYISTAFVRQQGPLSHYIVSSRLRSEAQKVQRPAILSLLPKSRNVWVTNILHRCSETQMAQACLAETR